VDVQVDRVEGEALVALQAVVVGDGGGAPLHAVGECNLCVCVGGGEFMGGKEKQGGEDKGVVCVHW
jgi:hypothetical protein